MSIGAYLSTREGARISVRPFWVGITTLCAFILFGVLPLLPYLFNAPDFALSCEITGVSFLIIGYLKGVMNKKSILPAILQVLFLGGVAAGVAYYAGVFLRSL